MRMAQTAGSLQAEHAWQFARLPDGQVGCQLEGPKLVFRSLLDSGATYPGLYREDFNKLIIDQDHYAAQSVDTIDTANGTIRTRVFELFVSVLDENLNQLVDPENAVWPFHAKYLGGLCPVAEIATPMIDAQGREVNNRLSGLLPFVACYISSTPTRNTLFLGEDRKDVLGGHRMPGQRKWDISLPSGRPTDQISWDRFDNPKTTFTHRGGRIIDEDDPVIEHASTVYFNRGQATEQRLRCSPKEELEHKRVMEEMRRRMEAAKEPPKRSLIPPPLRI